LFSARLRVTSKSTLKSTSSPKESVRCVSAVLFLLCQSRYVLFLSGLPLFLFLLCNGECGIRASFLKPFKINDLIDFLVFHSANA
jgi:hypothetical protein